MPLAAPNNCWPSLLQKFVDAVANSAAFRTLVGAATEAEALASIFGKRLTHTQDGHAWTREELENLQAYAMVFGAAENPFGKHLSPALSYLPHGTTIIAVGRLVPEAELVAKTDNRNGLTDSHDRDWQNIVGTIPDQVLSWLRDNGGPWPVAGFDITDDSETAARIRRSKACGRPWS